MQECFCFSDHSADVYRKYHQAQHDHGRRAPCPYHRQLVERNGEKYVVLTHLDSGSGYFEEDLEYLNRPVSQQVHDFDGKKSEPTICSNGFILFMEKKPMRIFPTNPDGVQDQRLRFHTFHTGRMAIRRKAKLKHRNLFFHMLPTHLRSPAKETRAKACLKKAFGLLFVTIQIHAKRKKGTGLLQ